ncbi:MAG: hypothetical protein JSS43_15685 [Proteobacteria bacterium]|nr:hypothetical protein [Pseudomonadota bacterium]
MNVLIAYPDAYARRVLLKAVEAAGHAVSVVATLETADRLMVRCLHWHALITTIRLTAPRDGLALAVMAERSGIATLLLGNDVGFGGRSAEFDGNAILDDTDAAAVLDWLACQ